MNNCKIKIQTENNKNYYLNLEASSYTFEETLINLTCKHKFLNVFEDFELTQSVYIPTSKIVEALVLKS